MKKKLNFFKRLTSPTGLTIKDGISYWQEKILLNLLLAAAVLGLITCIPSVVLSMKEGLWVVAVIDMVMYLIVLYFLLKQDLSFTLRALCLTLISYLLGMVLIIILGPFGAGSVWLFFFPVISGVLLGYKMAFTALAVNTITIMGFGVLLHFHSTDSIAWLNLKTWIGLWDKSVEEWVVVGLNFILLNTAVALSVTTILSGLQRSMKEVGKSEKKYRRIFNNILDVYFEMNMDGILLEISPSIERLSQYALDELKGNTLFHLYKDPVQGEKMARQLFRDRYLNGYEIPLVNKDGTIRFCSVNARILKDEKGKPERIIGIFRDISDQKNMKEKEKELEDRLNRSQKMEALGLLAGGVAHDLNNILSGIVTYPEFLAMDLDEDDPLRKSLGIIQSSGNRATQIVQDLLTLSRRGVITREVLDLNDLVLDFLCTPEYEKILSFHPGIVVETNINARVSMLKGSSVHLQKTVMNLISNAAEAQPDGGTIQLGTRNRRLEKPIKGYDRVAPGDYIVLSVKDEGMGISSEDLLRIFEPFFTKKAMGRSGTGLGMAVVWGTVQDHEGYIDIISKINEGTTFEIYFPVSSDDTIKKASDTLTLNSYQGNGEKILIIDDVAEQRQIAGITLEKLGYQTNHVESGEAAIEYLKEKDADLLLLDMIMDPGISGLETYKRILTFKPNQKAIIASGFSQNKQINDTLALGAGGYLKKPYTMEQIGVAIKNELLRPAADG